MGEVPLYLCATQSKLLLLCIEAGSPVKINHPSMSECIYRERLDGRAELEGSRMREEQYERCPAHSNKYPVADQLLARIGEGLLDVV